MIEHPGPGPKETRDRNLSPLIARIRDDGPALVDGGAPARLQSQDPSVLPGLEALRADHLVWEDAPRDRAVPPPVTGASQAPAPAAPRVEPLAERPPPAAAQPPQGRGWLLPGALAAAGLVALGAAGLAYIGPAPIQAQGSAGAQDPALRSQMAALQGTIATLAERIDSLTAEPESHRVEALGERLDRMSRQVAALARDERLPADLDRRLEALAQGLDSTAQRLERLSAVSAETQGGESSLEQGGEGRDSGSGFPGRAEGRGPPAIAEATAATALGSGGAGVAGQGLGSVLAQPQALGDPLGAGKVPDATATVPETAGLNPEVAGLASAPPAPGDPPVGPPPGVLGPPEPPPLGPRLSQDGAGAPLASEAAQWRAEPPRKGPVSAVDPVDLKGLGEAGRPGQAILVQTPATEADKGRSPKGEPPGEAGGKRDVQPTRQRVAAATKVQPKGPAAQGDAPVSRPAPRVVDDLF